jgi:tight adherence protein B
MKQRLLFLLTAAALLLAGAVAVANAASTPLVVRDAAMGDYPKVTFRISLPSSMLEGDASTPAFTASENGRSIEVVTTSRPKVDPIDVVLVIDTSGSMKGRSLDAAKGAAQVFIDDLESGSKVSVISFSDKPHVLQPLAENSPRLTRAIAGLQAAGETAMYDALAVAAAEASRAGARRPVIVLLSDGGDTVSRINVDAAVKSLKKANAPALVVALPSAESDFAVLRSIATQTGGRFATVSSADQLVSFYRGLARELQTTWDVTVLSRRPSTKDLDITISARVGKKTAAGSSLLPNPVFETVDPAAAEPVVAAPPANRFTLLTAVVMLFGSVFAFVVAGILMAVKPRTTLEQLKYYDQMTPSGDSEDAEDHSSVVTSSVLGAVDYVAGKRGVKRMAYEQLERAGLPMRPVEYITIHLLVVIASGAVAEVLSGNLLVGILAVILATALPLVYVDRRIKKRRSEFETQLPDVLNLISGALRAGWGLQQSLDLVVEQTGPPMSTEFARAVTETRLGRSVEEALEAVAERMQSEDFTWAVTAIGIQRDVGGNLAEVLDVVAATIRDRAALKRQIASLTAEGRLSAVILLVLPFVLIMLLSIVNPTYLQKLFTTAPGLAMALTGVVLLVVGALWLRRVVEIEV